MTCRNDKSGVVPRWKHKNRVVSAKKKILAKLGIRAVKIAVSSSVISVFEDWANLPIGEIFVSSVYNVPCMYVRKFVIRDGM